MSLNDRPDDAGLELVQHQPMEPQDEETRRLKEADQLRAYLKAETGYQSYAEFLGAHEELSLKFFKLKHNFLSNTREHQSNCFIFDLFRDPDSQANIKLRCRTSSAVDTLTNLRHPSTESSVQVCLWSTSRGDLEWVSALGLGLRIDAPFFEAVRERKQRPQGWRKAGYGLLRGEMIRYGRPFSHAHLEIDGKIMIIANHQSSNQIRSVPVVLIAGVDLNFEGISQKIGDVLPLLDSLD